MATPTFVRQGIKAMQSGCQIGGVTIFVTANGSIGATDPVPNQLGDILLNTAQGKMYLAGGVSSTSDWKLVTSA